jgi:uncharacterized protein (TIGR03032 family)
MALTVAEGRPEVTFMRVPHPSGLAVDSIGKTIFLASTRNPNQLLELAPVVDSLPRRDAPVPRLDGRPLVPVRSRFLPGSLYLHDLAFVADVLYGNAVGQNAVVRLDRDSGYERVWWPRCIERESGPDFTRNYLQLNSIAAGTDLASSFFSASATKMSARRPGHKNFPVDRRGVIFSGKTRDPIATGLTRPHSARMHRGRLWVDNSGYGEVGVVEDGSFTRVATLPGWTRGLTLYDRFALVGTSRVIPRFRQYAPGLNEDKSSCGIHVVDTESGETLGSLTWPEGNQIFAVEWISRTSSTGFPFAANRRRSKTTKLLFYSFVTDGTGRKGDG